MERPAQRLFEFGSFRLDTRERQLWRGNERIALTPKAFDTLVVLVKRQGQLVEKEALLNVLWPNSFVEEANITNNIWTLRKALGESQNGQGYIETVPKRGYRFVVPVREVSHEPQLMIEKHTITRIVTEEDDGDRALASGDLSPLVAIRTESQKPPSINRRVGVAVWGAILILCTGFAVYKWRGQPKNVNNSAVAVTDTRFRSVAVLPFKAIGDAKDQEYLGLGLADALITKLGNVRELLVRPTGAVRGYTDTKLDAATIGREQHVDAVLDGSFQRTDDRLRVTVQLIRVVDGSAIWSAQFDERFNGIFSVQDSISERVACDLVTRICGEATSALVKQNKVNIQAYEFYLKGRYFWNKRTHDGFQKAVDYFRQAIEVDPAYARAYAGLGDGYYFLGGSDLAAQTESYEKGRAATKRALELDETLSEPHATLGLMAMNNEGNWSEAEREFRRAIELNPNYATSHQWHGEFLAYMGRFDEAIAELKLAHQLDPLSLIISTDLAKVYTLARRYDEAIVGFQKTLEVDPNFSEARALLASTYSIKGMQSSAIEEFQKIDSSERHPFYLSLLGYAYGKNGQHEEAQRVLNDLRKLSQHTYVSPYVMSYVYLGLGDKEEAFSCFDQIFKERTMGGIVSLKINPYYDELRADPRYADFLRRAHFAE